MVVWLLISVWTSACASYQARRERYESLGDREYIVRGQAEEFRVGGRAAFIHERCPEPLTGPDAAVDVPRPCRETMLGGGDVVERLDRHHFVIRADPDVDIARTTRVIPAQGRAHSSPPAAR